jgi:hypothetical protein
MGEGALCAADLAAQFYPVDDLGKGFVRCGDELPKKTIYTYFPLHTGSGHCPFVVSKDKTDDGFARMVLETCGDRSVVDLTKIELRNDSYGFTHLLCVHHTYHSELKGRMDAARPSLGAREVSQWRGCRLRVPRSACGRARSGGIATFALPAVEPNPQLFPI